MKHSSRRILALLLALSLCIGMMPMSIFAEPETEAINEQSEEKIELSQSETDDSADLEEESEGVDVFETDAKGAPEAAKKADVTVLEEKKVDLEKVDLDKIEKDMPSALTEVLPEADTPDAQEDEKDEGDDVAGDDKAQMNFAKVWKGDEETDARPSTNEYGKCVTLYQYYPKTEELVTIDTAPVVTTAEDSNIYYVTWASLPRYADGQELVYYAKETAVPDGYLESYIENSLPENAANAVKTGKLPAADEAVYLKGTILNEYVGSTDFTVTVRWEDENDKYGNRPSAENYAEAMGLTLWSEINATDYDPLRLSEREAKVTDNNDGTYTVTWENLPASFNGEDMVYIAREEEPGLGYDVTYENKGDHNLSGAYAGDTIINRNVVLVFDANKVWKDAENKNNERPESITIRLWVGEEELASKTVTGTESWSASFNGDYPAYRNGEAVEYHITEDPVDGYRTEIEKVDLAEADVEEPDPGWNEEELKERSVNMEAKAAKRVEAASSEATGTAVTRFWVYTVTNIKTVDVTAIKTWDDENDADGFRPELKDFAENYLHLGVLANTGPVGPSDKVREERVEAKQEIVAKAAETLKAVKTDGTGSDTLKPTNYSENGNIYTVVWEGLDKYDGDKAIIYIVSEDEIDEYKSSIPTNEPGEAGPVWKFTNTHKHETREFSVRKDWFDGDDKEGDRPDHITVNLIADGKVVDTLIITPNEEGFWGGSFEDSYPKYKDGKEIKYELVEEPIDGYFTIVGYAEFAHFDEGGTENPVVKKVAKSADDSVTKGEFIVTNAKVVDVTITKIWNDDNNRDGKRPSLKRFIEAVGLELHAFVGYKDVLIEPLEEMGPVVTKCEDDSFIGDAAYTITWTNLLKYLEDDNGEYQEAKYFAKENLSKVSALGYSPSNFSVVFAPQVPPDQEAVARVIRGAANNGGSITNEYTPEKLSITITKSWADGDNPDRPESVTVNLLANGEPVFEEAAVLSAENDWTVTYDDLYEFENRKPIDYTIEEEQIEGYARPDYSKSTDEDGNILLDVCNSLPADKPFSITKRWADNNNEDGNRPTPEELIENGAFVLRRTTDPQGQKYDYPDSFDPEIVDNKDNTYTVTWKDLPKYNKEDGNVWLYSVGEFDFNTYQPDGNIGTGYYLTSSTMGSPDPTDWESNSFPMENYKHAWVYNGGSFTNTYQRHLMHLDIKKIWDDNDNEHGKRPDSITVVLFEEIDGNKETVRTVTITPDEKGEWIVTLKDLQRFRNGEAIPYDIEELEVEGYITTYKNSLKPEPVDPSDPNNPTIDPDEPFEPFEPGEGTIPVTPGQDELKQEYQDVLKKAVTATSKEAVKAPRVGVVIDEIPQQNVFVVESITITNKEYCTARWVDENGTLIPPTEDGKYEPVEFDYDAEKVPDANTYGNGPEKEGYTFAGWETIENVDEDGNKTGDITYQATYTQDAIVRYHSNYPEALELADLQKDEYYSEKRDYTIANLERVGFDDLTEKGYQFLGWTTSEDGTVIEYKPGDSYPAAAPANGTVATSSAASSVLRALRSAASSSEATGEENIVLELYAQWSTHVIWKDADENGTTLFEDDFDEVPAAEKYKELSKNQDPTKEGSIFTGWSDPVIDEAGNVVYTAQYTPIETIHVIWKDDNGDKLFEGDYEKVPAATEYNNLSGKDDPTKDGSNFNGWSEPEKDADGNFVKDADGNIVYTAQYTPNETIHVIWKDDNGDKLFEGDYDEVPTADKYNELSQKDNPTKDGSTFNGWSDPVTDENGNVVYTAQYTMPNTPTNNNSTRPTTPTEDPVTEEPTEIDDGDTPLAPGTVEEEDTNIDDGDVPLAGVEEEEEIAEEATPLTPFTGDGRHTVVWGIVSILSLLGIALLTFKRRREE